MKPNQAYQLILMIWIITAIASVLGMIITGSANCLWAMALPVCMGTKTESNTGSK